MVVEINNKTGSRIDLSLVQEAGEKFLRAHKKFDYSVSLAFVGDKKIRQLNKKYRGIDRVTDILSFPGEDKFLGEIIIDYSQIKRQAKELGNKPKDELVFILAHGLLHLLGHDDKTEAGRKKMEKLGNKFIKSIKL
ncbi:MAG: rRNA maturation RNase YbeY [Patescibacteria group bacterium]|nr:rRNA maturation RNase YbeY [Patescibacteria group bacterium]